MQRLLSLWLLLAPPTPSRAPEFDTIVPIEAEGRSDSTTLEPALAQPAPPLAAPTEEQPSQKSQRKARIAKLRKKLSTKPWGGDWRKWGAPLISAFLPGLGQLANGSPAKAVGIFVVFSLGVSGSIGLIATQNDPLRERGSLTNEYLRLIGFGLLSTRAVQLWVFAIADAWRVAGNHTIEPNLRHKLRFGLSRSMTVAFGANPDRPVFYDDWSLEFLGQVARRVTVGATDLGIKFEDDGVGVVQAGARVEVRVFDRNRIWVDLGVGTALQLAIHRPTPPLDPDADQPKNRVRFGAVPYGQIGLRWFILDRLSLDLTPRLTVPVTTHYYSREESLPRFVPTLQLPISFSAYF